MEYENIDDIYAANARVRERLKASVSELSASVANARPDGEKWSIAEILEHIARVNFGTARICQRLLQKASEGNSTGAADVKMSDGFRAKSIEIASMKVEAPEIVQPTGNKTIQESLEELAGLEEKFESLRQHFNEVDSTAHKFPHPFFGEINAQEWLALSGGHEARHLKQIEKVLALVDR